MAWKVNLGQGRVFVTDDLTIDEIEMVEKASGTGWWFLNPLKRAGDLRGLVAFFLVREGVMTDEEAKAEVGRLRVGAASKIVTLVPDEESDLPSWYDNGIPKAEGEPETT